MVEAHRQNVDRLNGKMTTGQMPENMSNYLLVNVLFLFKCLYKKNMFKEHPGNKLVDK